MRSYTSTGRGYTGADYRRGLPKGVPNREGDLFIDTEAGRAYRAIRGPKGDLRLIDVASQLLTSIGSWEATYRMERVMAGETLRVGAREWKVTKVDGDQISYEDEHCKPNKADVAAAAKKLQAERDAWVRHDQERKLEKAQRRETVGLYLKDAGVEFVSLAYDVNEARGGVVVQGVENREALPDTLIILSEQEDAIIVGLKREVEAALDKAADALLDEVGEPDLEADAALTETELNASVVEPLNAPTGPEPKKSRVEIKTLMHVDDGEGFDTCVIPDGWEFVAAQYQLFPLPGSPAWQDSLHVRYITLKRVVSE